VHLVVHDDWSCYTTFRRPGRVAGAVRWACRRVMRPVYRRAASRLCVSPGMVETYRTWFGVDGSVLYPSRGDDSPVGQVRVRPAGGPPVVAFCGNVHLDGTADLLRRLAVALAAAGGVVELYTQTPPHRLAAFGLDLPNVRSCGFYPAAEMGERVGRTAHVLFLPTSFEARERLDVATLFPSKLADYTAIGLPVLIWAPPESSAGRWAAGNPGAAVCVTDPDPAAAAAAATRLAADPGYAAGIAAAGLAV